MVLNNALVQVFLKADPETGLGQMFALETIPGSRSEEVGKETGNGEEQQ